MAGWEKSLICSTIQSLQTGFDDFPAEWLPIISPSKLKETRLNISVAWSLSIFLCSFPNYIVELGLSDRISPPKRPLCRVALVKTPGGAAIKEFDC